MAPWRRGASGWRAALTPPGPLASLLSARRKTQAGDPRALKGRSEVVPRKAQNFASGPRRPDTQTHAAASAPPGGVLFLLPSPKSTAPPTSERQVPRVKQREGPILSEERFSAAHLTGDQFLLHWGACGKMSEARNGSWEREPWKPCLRSPGNLPVLYPLWKCGRIKGASEEPQPGQTGSWLGVQSSSDGRTGQSAPCYRFRHPRLHRAGGGTPSTAGHRDRQS